MKEKKDIFNGKVKKEYFSYIFAYMIFFLLLFVAIGVLCIYGSIWEMTTNSSGERLLMVFFGVISFVLAGVYVFLEFLVIRNFPKYEKTRRGLFNSDIYFTDSTSDEYFGGRRTIRGHRNKAAFDLVTAFAEAEKGMGDKKPVRYTVYGTLAIFMSVVGMVILIILPLVFEENSIIFPNISAGDFALFCVFIGTICVIIAVFFSMQSLKVARMAPYENNKWKYELYNSLVDIAVRKNNKKLKFWYDEDQLEQIENLVRSASKNAELKLQTKKNKIVSFKVIDTRNNSVKFTGYFI